MSQPGSSVSTGSPASPEPASCRPRSRRRARRPVAAARSYRAATKSMTCCLQRLVGADRLAASRTAFSPQSALRPRSSASAADQGDASWSPWHHASRSAAPAGAGCRPSDRRWSWWSPPGSPGPAERRSRPASPRRDWCRAPSPRHGWRRGCRFRRSPRGAPLGATYADDRHRRGQDVLDDLAHRRVEPAGRVELENDQARAVLHRTLQAAREIVGRGGRDRAVDGQHRHWGGACARGQRQ